MNEMEQNDLAAHPVCEAIELCEELSYNLGCVVKYLWSEPNLTLALWHLHRERDRTLLVYSDAQAYLSGGREDPGPEEIDAVGAVQVGIPVRAKKLARLIAKHRHTSPLLRDVLESLADDTQSFKTPIAMLKQEIAARSPSEAT